MPIVLIAIVYFGFKLFKECMEDAEHREWARRNGYDSYWSNTGKRNVKDNSKYYK